MSCKRSAFTLIELLVIIAIITLMIALLLPVLTHAREAAGVAICLANQRQLALATLNYSADHDGFVPPSRYVDTDFRTTWTYTLKPWVSDDEEIFYCPIEVYPHTLHANPALTATFKQSAHVTYCPNGSAWLFWYQAIPGRGAPTSLNIVKSPSQLVTLREDTEDYALWDQYNLPHSWFLPLVSNVRPNFFYFPNPNSGARSSGGRHHRGGGGSTTHTWGFDTISFYDGHVITASMEQMVERQAPSQHWYEFPFVAAAARGWPAAPLFNISGPQPGAEWWMNPKW